MLEFIFEFILEGISEISQSLKIHPIIRIIIVIVAILAFSVFFIWLMNKLGIWK